MSKKLIWFIIFIAVVVGLFSLSKNLSPSRGDIKRWNEAGIGCLSNGHANLGQHMHQSIAVTIDGSEKEVSGDIGVVPDCLAEIHSHTAEPGVIHLETATLGKTFTLGDFFTMWGEPFERAGYAVTLLVDKATSTEGEKLILQDTQSIEVIYVGSTQKTDGI